MIYSFSFYLYNYCSISIQVEKEYKRVVIRINNYFMNEGKDVNINE